MSLMMDPFARTSFAVHTKLAAKMGWLRKIDQRMDVGAELTTRIHGGSNPQHDQEQRLEGYQPIRMGTRCFGPPVEWKTYMD